MSVDDKIFFPCFRCISTLFNFSNPLELYVLLFFLNKYRTKYILISEFNTVNKGDSFSVVDGRLCTSLTFLELSKSGFFPELSRSFAYKCISNLVKLGCIVDATGSVKGEVKFYTYSSLLDDIIESLYKIDTKVFIKAVNPNNGNKKSKVINKKGDSKKVAKIPNMDKVKDMDSNVSKKPSMSKAKEPTMYDNGYWGAVEYVKYYNKRASSVGIHATEIDVADKSVINCIIKNKRLTHDEILNCIDYLVFGEHNHNNPSNRASMTIGSKMCSTHRMLSKLEPLVNDWVNGKIKPWQDKSGKMHYDERSPEHEKLYQQWKNGGKEISILDSANVESDGFPPLMWLYDNMSAMTHDERRDLVVTMAKYHNRRAVANKLNILTNYSNELFQLAESITPE